MLHRFRMPLGGCLAAALTLCATWGAPASAQKAAPKTAGQTSATRTLIEKLPAGTLFVLSVKDLDRTKRWFEESPFKDLVKDPEVKPLWEKAMNYVAQWSGKAKEMVGVDFLDMLSQVKGEAAIALTRVQITRQGPSPGIMIALDCKDAMDGFQKDVDTLLKLIPEGMFKTAERELNGVKIRSFQPQLPPEDGSRRIRGPARAMKMIGNIHMAWLGTTLILSNDKSGFDKLIQVAKGEELKTLGDTQNWKDTMAQLGGAGDSTFFLNISAIAELLEMALPMMPDEVGPVLSALGLDEFPSLGASSFYAKDGVRSKMVLRYTGDGKSGIGSMLAFKESKLEIPRWVPEDAMQVFIFDYDFEAAFGGFMGMVQEMGEEPYEGVTEGLEEFNQEFGLSLQNDIIPALAGPIIMVQNEAIASDAIKSMKSGGMRNFNPMMGGGSTLLGIQIRNRKPIERMLEFLEGMGAEVSNYGGAKIFSPPTMDDDMPVTDLAITDNYVLAGIGQTSIVRPMLQRMGGQEPGLGAKQGVRDALATLPREGFGLWVVNYGKNISSSLNVMKMFMTVLDAPEDLAKIPLPSSSIFEKYFGYSGGVMSFKAGRGVLIDTNFLMKRP